MSEVKITENISDIINKLRKEANIEKIEKSVVNKGLSLIKKQTKTNLRASFPAAFRRSPLYIDTMSEGVRSSLDVHAYGVLGKVHVMGKKSAGSGTFRLRFFEGGTKDRYRKNGAFSGHIDPMHFFSDAVSQTEGQVDTEMEKEFDKQIYKIIKK